jgi:murein DD-endopeptidase MepM/ murein hydrolase activator NlpD
MRVHGAVPIVAALLLACDQPEPLLELIAPTESPRDEYVKALEGAGLAGTALLSDWTSAAIAVLPTAPLVPSAFLETALIDVGGTAHAYRVRARRGQRVKVEVEVHADAATRVFLDAFAAPAEPSLPENPLGHADAEEHTFAFEPDFDGEVLVRVQPELLRSGRLTVSIQLENTLPFPVAGHSMSDVGSVFGDARDGGQRSHHGIDIFAPRGTPVIAAVSGTVSRASETPRGGRVVWLRADSRRARLYYAHLDTQLVSSGMRVQEGDTLGLVGNTGNARTTPPHLHFGIYSRGPVDPVPFVRPVIASLPPPSRDSVLVGRWIRTSARETTLRQRPDSESSEVARLPRSTAMRVIGAADEWLRVSMPDGTFGFLPADAAEEATAPLRRTVVADGVAVLAKPDDTSPVIHHLDAGQSLEVHGLFRDFYLVRVRDIPIGWVAADDGI